MLFTILELCKFLAQSRLTTSIDYKHYKLQATRTRLQAKRALSEIIFTNCRTNLNLGSLLRKFRNVLKFGEDIFDKRKSYGNVSGRVYIM